MKTKKVITSTFSLRVNEKIRGAVLADELARTTESKYKRVKFFNEFEAILWNSTSVVYKKAYDTSRAGRILVQHHSSDTNHKILISQITGCIIIQ